VILVYGHSVAGKQFLLFASVTVYSLFTFSVSFCHRYFILLLKNFDL